MIVALEKPGSPEELVDSLEHHGIKGMRWGIRKKEETSNNQGSAKSKTDADTKSFLSRHKKAILIGAGTTVVILGAYGAYKLHDSRIKNVAEQGDKVIGVSFRKKDILARKMTSKQIMTEVVPQVNPDFKSKIQAQRNCLRASFAYELRRRGYDVEATHPFSVADQTPTMMGRAMSGNILREFHIRGLGQHDIPMDRWDREDVKASHIFDALAKHEEGARGELGLGWRIGGGHSVSWEIIGGKPHIFDCQTGEHYKTSEEFLSYAKHIGGAAFTRLDDVDLDEGFLTDWVKNAR